MRIFPSIWIGQCVHVISSTINIDSTIFFSSLPFNRLYKFQVGIVDILVIQLCDVHSSCENNLKEVHALVTRYTAHSCESFVGAQFFSKVICTHRFWFDAVIPVLISNSRKLLCSEFSIWSFNKIYRFSKRTDVPQRGYYENCHRTINRIESSRIYGCIHCERLPDFYWLFLMAH